MFIRPLAEPENRGAISMGIAQKGPMVDSAKKNAALRQRATSVKLWESNTGTMNNNDQRKPPMIMSRRALLRSPVLFRMKSLTMPPNASPATPARNTPLENRAEFFRFNLYP